MFSLPVLIARGLDLQFNYAGMPYLFNYFPLFSFEGAKPSTVGVFNAEGPPVPIPNTEVKLSSAENTCLATDWEDRSMPTHDKIPEAFASGIFLPPFRTKLLILSYDSRIITVHNRLPQRRMRI